MRRIAVLVSGSGSNLQSLIDAQQSGQISGAQIALVISSKPNVFALERAATHGIASRVIRTADYSPAEYEKALLNTLTEHSIDTIVLAGFLAILPQGVIGAYRGRIVNIHPSLIPSFCGKGFYGARVHRAVYESAVKLTGATVHFVDEGIDTGKVICQCGVAVAADDTPETIAAKVLKIEHQILPEVVAALVADRIEWVDERPFIRRGEEIG